MLNLRATFVFGHSLYSVEVALEVTVFASVLVIYLWPYRGIKRHRILKILSPIVVAFVRHCGLPWAVDGRC